MENIQINGQRRWGPPKDWTGPPPPHGTEIFIKNLADDVYEEEIFRIFSGAGSIFEVRLPVHWNGANRGYAFVRYTRPEEAEAGIALFDRHQLRPGKPIRVERSVDNTRLFLSAVQKDKTAEDIKNDLSELVEKVEKVYVYPTLEDRTVFRGYAFVEFETHRDAAIAKRILTPDVCASVFEKKCIAAWANPLPFLDGNLRQTINVLFMRNIPKEMKNFDLKKEIKDLLGSEEIFKIKRLKNFAFLTFKDHHQTEAALNRLRSEFSFTNRYDIEVDWAVPRELAQSVSSHLRKSSVLALRETEFQPSCEKTGKFEPKQSQEANGMQYGNLISTFLPRSDAINFQKAGKIPTETDWPLFFRSSPGPQLVSVPEPNVPKFKIGGPTFARPIRGSKFSPPVSYCDSDAGDSLSPPTTFPWDFRDLGFFLEGPVREVNPFYFGAREPFAIP